MKVNAEYILDYLSSRGWSKNSVCGMLGNMQTESTINPGIWQNLDQNNLNVGFGLVQWTPASKYTSWATSNGYQWNDIKGQLNRLDYEIQNGLQWISTSDYPISFQQFKTSGQTPEYLAQAFLRNYERPANQNQPNRSTQARYWYDLLSGGSSGGMQLAQFPLDMIHVTQGENGSFSHLGTLCIDFVGTYDKYPYYAPCDCECIARLDSDAIMVWKSTSPVMCADGQVREIVWDCIHESPLRLPVGTKLKKGELMGYTGVGGFATGDHLHLNVIEGNTYNGFVQKPHYALAGTELHIYDVFAVNGVNMVNGYGYDWKTSDYQDGSDGGTPAPPKNKNKQLIQMWLADTLNGWRN
jgi:hypothetical protein